MADITFQFEVFTLLQHVAWVDGHVAPAELLVLRQLGERLKLPAEVVSDELASLKNGEHPGEPDWSVLKPRAAEVLEAARGVAAADGRIAPEEKALLEKVAKALDSAV